MTISEVAKNIIFLRIRFAILNGWADPPSKPKRQRDSGFYRK